MKATELRIGNLVHIEEDRGGKTRLRELKILADMLAHEHVVGWIHPIPLTEEWPEKFGLVERDSPIVINNVWNYTVEYYKNKVRIRLRNVDRSIIKDNIKYVHQLQNLIFALTGKELTIKK